MEKKHIFERQFGDFCKQLSEAISEGYQLVVDATTPCHHLFAFEAWVEKGEHIKPVVPPIKSPAKPVGRPPARAKK